MADEYEYKDSNTDMMKALSKAVDAATGETGTQYEYKNPDTDVIQKLEELTKAIATSGGGSQYSTTEHIVGTWIDGKTLYEKTVSFTTASTGSYTQQSLDLLSSEIDTIFVQSGYVLKGDNVASWGAYGSSVEPEQCVGFIYKGSTNISFDYRVGSSYFAGLSNLTIRYTKSSI